MADTMRETAPGVWKLRAYVGRKPNGQPIQISKTVHTGDVRPGSGRRAADRALAKLVSEVDSGKLTGGTVTVKDLRARYLDHCKATGKQATTLREYRRIAEKT
jgi:hypothetical protein